MYIYGYLLYIFLKNVNVRNETILTLLQHLPMCYVKIGCLLSLFKRKTEQKMSQYCCCKIKRKTPIDEVKSV